MLIQVLTCAVEKMLIKVIKILLFLFVVRQLIWLILLAGFHKTMWNHWPGPCRNVAPIEEGAEDIVVTKEGMAIISSGVDISYRGELTDPRFKNAEGKLFSFNFNNPTKNATKLDFKADFEFKPQGMSLWEADNGVKHIFVVNHRKAGEYVEIFKLSGTVEKPVVEHVRSVEDQLFTSLNDVIATGLDSFYATNDGLLRFSNFRIFERLFRLRLGSVVHFDGSSTRVVVPSTFEYNGMDMSTDGRFVFIASPFVSESITIYERSENNDLKFHQEVVVGTLIDNIYYDPETADLWCGCAPIAHRMIEALENADAPWAPSFVLRVKGLGPKDKPFETFKLYDVFADDGILMSSSASAVVRGNKLLIGSIHHKLSYCEMTNDLG